MGAGSEPVGAEVERRDALRAIGEVEVLGAGRRLEFPHHIAAGRALRNNLPDQDVQRILRCRWERPDAAVGYEDIAVLEDVGIGNERRVGDPAVVLDVDVFPALGCGPFARVVRGIVDLVDDRTTVRLVVGVVGRGARPEVPVVVDDQ